MWLAPWFLLGLAGIALPVWLHRFARHTEQKHAFPSTMFLEPSQIRQSRRRELRYWLLLALRVLLLALLALAFAGPLWRSPVKAGDTGATLHVIALDTSLSMRQSGAWDNARNKALELIASLRGNDRAMLVAADHRISVLQEPVFAGDVGRLRAAVNTLEPGYSRLDYGLLATASAGWGAGPGESLLVHFISDMQQSASPLRFADLAPPPGVRFELADVAPQAAVNLQVTAVREDEREAGTLDVTIDGDHAALAGRDIVIEFNGAERQRRAVRPGVSLPAVERFRLGELPAGEHRVTARLTPGDALAADDAHYVLLRHIEPKVLVIAADGDGDDARYLGAALQSLPRPRFEVEIARPAALATRQLGEFAAIVVSDAGLIDARSATALKAYLEAGGAALLTLGARAGQLSEIPVSGAKLARGSARAEANQLFRVADLEQSHAVLREPGAWRQVRFLKHVAVTPPDDARVLMRLSNGTPLLYEQSPGQGRMLVLASPLDRQWNDLAIHPLFVRFVAESAAWLAGARFDGASATVGTTIDAGALRRSGGVVFDPAGTRASLLGGSAEGLRWVPELPGFYEIRGGGQSDYVAVNADPRESRLARQDAGQLERWQALQPAPGALQPGADGSSAPERLIPVWFWLLLLATVLAFLEPVVANYHLNVRREQTA